MSGLLVALFLSLPTGSVHPAGSPAEPAALPSRTRTETMPFGECISLMEEVAEQLHSNPVTILRTGDVRIVRIDATDGAVILTCNRAENQMVLTKKPKG